MARPTRVLWRGRFAAPGTHGGYHMRGPQTARHKDEMPLYDNESPEENRAKFFANIQRKPKAMDGRRGWGLRSRRVDEGGAYASQGEYREIKPRAELEDMDTDQWRVNVEDDVHEVAGDEGLKHWKEQQQAELRRALPPKRFPNNAERQDVQPYEDWQVPLKRQRLLNSFKVDEMRLRKTPEFDLTPFRQRVIEKMWVGMEGALVDHPLPFHGSRENFCVTHIECLQWKSIEKFIVCWKLVLDESRRSDYEEALRGKVVDVWARSIHRRARFADIKPILHFVYDDGSIPYRTSIVEENILRSSRGLAPKPMHGKNHLLWGMATQVPADDAVDPTSAEVTATRAETADPVRDFLLEARSSLARSN